MSKIFEALQRAQQQGANPPAGAPSGDAPIVPAPVAPAVHHTLDPIVEPEAVVAPPPSPVMAPPMSSSLSSDLLFASADSPAYSPPAPAAAPDFGHSAATMTMAPTPAEDFGSAVPLSTMLPPRVEDEAATAWEAPSLVRFAPRSKVVVAQNPTSLAAEQYRVLRTNIIKLAQTQALKVILVTSPGPGDGKTLTAMNLALSFCQKPETRVLLVEADLRKPSVGALVAMEPGPGLSDYLSGDATMEQVVRPTSVPNFHLLDSGKRPSAPADLLHSPRLATLMDVVRSHFNWIVLDGPPTNPVADYELLTPICDGVVLVVRPFYTQRDLLRLTTEALRGRKVLGCVINGSKHFERYGSAYGYGYGYGPSNEAEPDATQRSRMKVKGKKKKPAKGEKE